MSAGVLSILVISLVAGVIAGVRLIRQSSQRGKLGRIAVVKIAALAPAEPAVRIVGTIRALDATTIAGPYTGTAGVAAVFERWEKSSTGVRIRRLDRQVRHTPFLVEDDTGSVRLVLDHADLLLELLPAKLAEAGPNRVFGAGIIAANRNNADDTLECVLKPGDRVAVVGRFESGATGTCLTGTSAAPLVVSNHSDLFAGPPIR